jgi:prepilin-type N-terminal cleavage/methylation domain-containing protein
MCSSIEKRARHGERGLGLTEMLVAIVLIGLFAVAASDLMAGLLRSESVLQKSLRTDPEAQRVLQGMAEAVAYTPHLHVPNGRARVTSDLVLSAGIDNDADGRVDEDPGSSGFAAGRGAPAVDDDGDGSIDESLVADDDEDGVPDDDPRNGRDDDGDGSIDEDPGADANADGRPGARGFDDDGDRIADEGDIEDDDEDGADDEDGWDLRRYRFERATARLFEQRPGDAEFLVLESVEEFTATYLIGAGGEPLVELRLQVARGEPSAPIVLETRVYPANQVARHGTTLP